jgi:hypothetical protein
MILSHSNTDLREGTVATYLSKPFTRYLGWFQGIIPDGATAGIANIA